MLIQNFYSLKYVNMISVDEIIMGSIYYVYSYQNDHRYLHGSYISLCLTYNHNYTISIYLHLIFTFFQQITEITSRQQIPKYLSRKQIWQFTTLLWLKHPTLNLPR